MHLVFRIQGVLLISIYHEFAEQEFKNKIECHGYKNNNIFVYTPILCHFSKYSGNGSEDKIESEHLCHSYGDVGAGFECKATIKGEVPKHRKS